LDAPQPRPKQALDGGDAHGMSDAIKQRGAGQHADGRRPDAEPRSKRRRSDGYQNRHGKQHKAAHHKRTDNDEGRRRCPFERLQRLQ
jgi:hypothetical protein